ncbi:MAG TPA: hypothetical protein VFZ70_16945 [Euzebyales bacterium]
MTRELTDRAGHSTDADVGRTLVIDVVRVHRFMAIVTGLLAVGAAAALVIQYPLGFGGGTAGAAARRLFGLNGERGFWAAASFLFLFVTAVTVHLGTWADNVNPSVATHSRRWRLLALAMVFVAFDEAFRVHEWINGFLQTRLGLTGFLHFAWVIPYGAAAAVIAGLMVRPLSELPRRTAALMVAGGFCYVLGAAGAELLDGQLKTINAPRSVRETQIVIEEALEWAGVWMFFAGVMTLLSKATLSVAVNRDAAGPG